MAVQRDKRNGQWRYRKVVRLLDGTKVRISGMPSENTKLAAQDAERAHIKRALDPVPLKKEVPTFGEWFNGRFWEEWVVGNRNKPSEVEAKLSVFKRHLQEPLGDVPLDQIDLSCIAKLKVGLIRKNLSEKRINNILTIVSKPLRYAVDARVLTTAPKVGLYRVERPEIEAWDMEEYAALLVAAKEEGEEWVAAIALAGEAGLRIGEVKALRWKEDVDLVAGTLTVNQQSRHGFTGTPKGRTRRTVPLNSALAAALRGLEQIRVGFVVRNLDGTPKTDGQAGKAIYRICRRAGLEERAWHALRHSFGTHAALCGVNPWRLMTWMGHKRIDETMLYVNFAQAHARPLPSPIAAAAGDEADPDRRVLKQLAARANLVTTPKRGEAESSAAIAS